ncbi:MAG: hypothetical protein WCW16_03405 [Candidatus Magasanikbacteria bacterium]
MRIYPAKLFFLSLPILVLTILGVLFNLASWVWLLLEVPHSTEQVFLHYNILFGVDKIGSWGKIFLVPLIGLIILLANIFFGWLSYAYDKFMSQVLLTASVIAQIFILIASILISFLNM